jgi:hypothetical protein
MAMTIAGVVSDGKIVPTSPLPEGLKVLIVLPECPDADEIELEAELSAWRHGNAKALQLIEDLVEAEDADAQR